MPKVKAFLGMSTGIDSSLAVAMLLEQGSDVVILN